jgi:hypothetical protein
MSVNPSPTGPLQSATISAMLSHCKNIYFIYKIMIYKRESHNLIPISDVAK